MKGNTAMKKLSTLLLTLMVCMLLSACSGTTGATIQEAHMTSALDTYGRPVDTTTICSNKSQKLIVSAQLHDAPDNTKVTFVWTYVENNQVIDSFEADSGEISDRYIFCELAMDKNWPVGEYKVEIYIDDNEKPAAVVEFAVEEITAANIQNAQMTTAVDGDGIPKDTVTKYSADEDFLASAVIYNVPKNTEITFVWTYVDSENLMLGKSTASSGELTNRYIYCNLITDKDWPQGEYKVEIYLGTEKTPYSVAYFTVGS